MGIKDIFAGPNTITVKAVEETFENCYDFEKRELKLGGSNIKATLCFIDGLVSGNDVSEQVIRPLTQADRFEKALSEKDAVNTMLLGSVYAYTAKERKNVEDVYSDMLNGYCAVIFGGIKRAVTFEVKSPEKRSIDQPKEEKVEKGAKDAFIEIVKTNTLLVRRKIANKNLKLEKAEIGSKTNTTVVIAYIDGFTNKNLVKEAKKRIENIKSESAITPEIIEENFIDQPKSPFPQMITTERSDKFCINILEGRVGVLVDGLPLGFLTPGTFSQFMKVPEDHARHFLVASLLTLLRYFSLLLTLFLPAFYVAIAMYHQEMIPSKLLQSIIDAKKAVPFPTAFEVLAMLIAFELLQEAGLRLPNPIGETVSIIGALIVGQSAVEAKVVSPAVVVVIALAGIAGYTMPNQDMGAALRLCRFLLVLAAILFGMFGIAIGAAIILYHMCSLESLGVPYMTPFSGSDGKYVARALVRYPMNRKKDVEPALRTEDAKEHE